MEVKSNIIEFPLQRLTEAKIANRSGHSAQPIFPNQANIVSLPLVWQQKEVLSLMRWASQAGTLL